MAFLVSNSDNELFQALGSGSSNLHIILIKLWFSIPWTAPTKMSRCSHFAWKFQSFKWIYKATYFPLKLHQKVTAEIIVSYVFVQKVKTITKHNKAKQKKQENISTLWHHSHWSNWKEWLSWWERIGLQENAKNKRDHSQSDIFSWMRAMHNYCLETLIKIMHFHKLPNASRTHSYVVFELPWKQNNKAY